MNKKHLFFFVLILLIILSYFFIKSEYYNSEMEKISWERNANTNRNIHNYNKLNDLSEGDFIQFIRLDMDKLHNTMKYNFGKVEGVFNDSVALSLFSFQLGGTRLSKINAYYEKNKKKVKEVVIFKKDLERAICDNYNPIIGYSFCGIDILRDNEKLRIYNIDNAKEPIIKFGSINYNFNGNFNFSLYSEGEIVYLKNAESIYKTIIFTNKIPFIINKSGKGNTIFSVSGTGLSKGEEATIIFSFSKDTLNSKVYKYQFVTDGKDYNNFIKLD